MKKFIAISIWLTVVLFAINLVMPTTVLSEGHPKPKEWKGEGTKIEFQSIPVITVKDFLNGKVPEKARTVWGTLNFPANAPDKNVPVVVVLHGMGGIHDSAEFWLSALNSMVLQHLWWTVTGHVVNVKRFLKKQFQIAVMCTRV